MRHSRHASSEPVPAANIQKPIANREISETLATKKCREGNAFHIAGREA
jgi:hypothetical protein